MHPFCDSPTWPMWMHEHVSMETWPFYKRMVDTHVYNNTSFFFKHRTILAYWPWTWKTVEHKQKYILYLWIHITCCWGKEQDGKLALVVCKCSCFTIIPWIHYCICKQFLRCDFMCFISCNFWTPISIVCVPRFTSIHSLDNMVHIIAANCVCRLNNRILRIVSTSYN